MSVETPTHICIDCGVLGDSRGSYHRHGPESAGDVISLDDMRKQWAEHMRELEDIREDLRCLITDVKLERHSVDEMTVTLPTERWTNLLFLAQWSPPYRYPCCNSWDGCGGPCDTFPSWDLTT